MRRGSSDDSPYQEPGSARPQRSGRRSSPRSHAKPHHVAAAHANHGDPTHPPRGAKKRSRRKRGGGGAPPPGLTSQPTSRKAFVNTRQWLLDEYGPICAYCGTKHPERSITLDHVAPRRGQTAYDRRDNLVLACRPCNEKKRDMAPLAFLLGSRARAGFLLRYGAHLSHGLLEMVTPLAKGLPPGMGPQREKFGPAEDDEESPYRD